MVIETKRLILRKPELSDVEDYLGFVNSEFVLRYNAMASVTRDRVEQEFANAQDDFSIVAIVLKATNKVIGIVNVQEDSLRYKVASKELSYFLREEESRKGHMKEALGALIRYFFEQENLDCVSARCFIPNVASQRLLESLGFVKEGVLRKCVQGYQGVVFDDCLYSLMREDWFAKQ